MRKALFILADLEDRDLIWLLQNGEVISVAAGETLIKAGQAVGHLYFVIEGKLAVLLPDGARDRLAPADVVGEMSFVENRLPSATVVADVDSSLLAVPREAILARFEEDVGFAARFYRALAVFLSDRLRTARGGVDSDELDEGFLERLHVAGDRFIRLLAMAKGRAV
jgi:CRP-like cAMP-binding protein